MSVEPVDFIRRALTLGKTRLDITTALKQAGWADEEVKAGLSAFADVEFAVPVPAPKPYLSAREVFLYLLMFSALYCCSYHAGSLFFDVINLSFPDPADNYSYWMKSSEDSIRRSVSALIVALPVFLFTFRTIHKAIAKDPARRNSRPRKWLTYLTLFAASLVLMGDAGTLVNNVLSGEMSIRFLLKVLAVLIIAGGNFLYFLNDMRCEEVR